MAVAMLRRRASRNRPRPRPETLEYAKYVIAFTTFRNPSSTPLRFCAGTDCAGRWSSCSSASSRWPGWAHLPKRDSDSARAWLYGKLLVEKTLRHATALSLWASTSPCLAGAVPSVTSILRSAKYTRHRASARRGVGKTHLAIAAAESATAP